MDVGRLKQVGQAARSHYEKFILSFMLLVLAIAVWILWQEKQREDEKMKGVTTEVKSGKPAPVNGIDLSAHRAALQKAQAWPTLTFAEPHNLFNPVKWTKKLPEGSLIKVASGKEVGVEALLINRIRPLYFSLAADRPSASGCNIWVTNELGMPALRRIFVAQTSVNRTNQGWPFIVRQIGGTPENPEWAMELTPIAPAEPGTRARLTKDTPFISVQGYEAELKYPPANNRIFSRLRPGTNWVMQLEGEDYKVIAVRSNEVVLSGRLNDQHYSITQSAP
jgi:hypothetical protein